MFILCYQQLHLNVLSYECTLIDWYLKLLLFELWCNIIIILIIVIDSYILQSEIEFEQGLFVLNQ